MSRIGELTARDVWEYSTRLLSSVAEIWAAASRTLTGISAEDVVDLPLLSKNYGAVIPQSAATANAWGSWVEVTPDIGVGKRLIFVAVTNNIGETIDWELQIGTGAVGAETAIAIVGQRQVYVTSAAFQPYVLFPLFVAVSDNARVAVRARDSTTTAGNYPTTLFWG